MNDPLRSVPELNYILFPDDKNIFSTDAELLTHVNDKTFQVIFEASSKPFNPLCHVINLSNKASEQKPSTKLFVIEPDSTITFEAHLKSLFQEKKLNFNDDER